jgi:hypothetical protein
MSTKQGLRYAESIGVFIIYEEEGTAEIIVQDAPPLETHEEAEKWIAENGVQGVDYFICLPAHRISIRRV